MRVPPDFVALAISIHALREEGDYLNFELTRLIPYFYPRPPRGGRQTKNLKAMLAQAISIHALREEGDGKAATADFDTYISIHALREEGDLLRTSAPPFVPNFYPRPPRGGRQQKQRKNPCFYSIINHSAQNGKNCNCAEHERCVFCGKNIRFSGAKKTEKA